MYADFTKDRIDAFLRDISGEPSEPEMAAVSEDLLDEILLAQMEMARLRASRVANCNFVPRAAALAAIPRIHSGDFH